MGSSVFASVNVQGQQDLRGGAWLTGLSRAEMVLRFRDGPREAERCKGRGYVGVPGPASFRGRWRTG